MPPSATRYWPSGTRCLADARLKAFSPHWALLAALWCAASVLATWLPANSLDWQPARALAEPWRAFTAIAVHWSPQHLGTNLLAAAVVGGYGCAAGVPRRATLAWGLAWPLTHVALAVQPALAHYGGLSGVLHAGVAIVTLWLLLTPGRGTRWRQAIGAMVAIGLVVKLVSEEPWGPALRASADWDIAVAPLAHATGSVAGLLCGAALLWRRPAATSS